MLVHELIHIAFPSVPDEHHWLEEGLAVYVEAVARAQSGELSPQQVWAGMVRGMPHGLPRAGDKGLDHTNTWGRTYWGGALFCLLADIEIRKLTAGKRTLRDGLRAIVLEGWTITEHRELLSVLAVADRALGAPVLRRLYDKMKDKPAPVDLADLWRQLGVVAVGESVTFDDNAPLASIRHAITARSVH